MVSISWTDQAVFDLTNIAEFISKDSPTYARNTVNRIRTAVNQLKQFPLSGRIVPETNLETIREIIIGNFRIIYLVVSAQRIDILTVHHSARRLDSKQLQESK
jgi:toxin ParE1/3/4